MLPPIRRPAFAGGGGAGGGGVGNTCQDMNKTGTLIPLGK